VLGDTVKANCFDARTQAHIGSHIADCDDAIQNLARELEKVKKAVPLSATGGCLSLKGKLGNAGKTLLYPFRESTLKKLRGYVEEVCENLAVATRSVQL
jgi:archaellum component FlaC